jgi:hypothetical protein
MKKLILTLTIAAFAVSTATFADSAKKECPLAAAKKQQCSADKKACCSAKKATAACCTEGASKQALLSPKAKS